MNVVTSKEYDDEKRQFFAKHGTFRINTSAGSAEYYHKEYVFEDNAVWYEVMMRVSEPVHVEVKKCHITMEADLLRTEYYNSDDADSKYYFEPWDHQKEMRHT